MTTQPAPAGIRVEAVSKQFAHRVKGQVYAVDRVDLDVAPGELLTLLGPSGCGKTTTLRMIAGFEQPDSGRILIGERDVTRALASQRDIGMVFQSYALFPHLSVFENVAYGLRVQRRPETAIVDAVREVLALVGLGGYERQMPHQLSGGEQQRVALARAIVFRPRVLLFDEPLSNLDAKLRVQMRGEIQRLQKRLGITAIYVTHDQEEAMAISDRIAVMNKGKLVQLGTADALYRRPEDEFVAQFIGRVNLVPVRVLAASGEEVEIELWGRRLRIAGASGAIVPGPARLVLRPEMARLGPDGPFAAKIVERTYLGEKSEYRIEIGDLVLQVAGYDGDGPGHAPGSTVRLALPERGLHFLP